MSDDVLAGLGLTPDQIQELPANDRSRLLNFLLRWEYLAALHECLDALIPTGPPRVSLLDLRAKAFMAQGRHDDALEVMRRRLEIRTSFTARSLLARVHLSVGDIKGAHTLALIIVREREESTLAWSLLAEVELARGQLEAAQNAYQHLRELRPNGRAYLLGMVALHQARGDWVTASGYAVRLLQTANPEYPLSIPSLRRLLAYFQASDEHTRAVEVTEALGQRQEEELSTLRKILAGDSGGSRVPAPPQPVTEASLVESLLASDQIPVSDQERERIAKAARQLFGFETLLPGQLPTIASVLRGEDTLTILPTGGGKSLCYQLPALLSKDGTTLVISPLIALMKDQVDSLPYGVRHLATTIHSSLQGSELYQRLSQTVQGRYRLVYAAPERLRQPSFLHALRRAGINLLVIDEAHCVSVWGHDFRPDYLTIDRARDALGAPSLLALTATAPPRVRRDILNHLGDMTVIAGDVTRPNLQLEALRVRNRDEKLRALLAFCKAERGSGIVYADTRARCERVDALLRKHGVDATHYHAGIADRGQVQEAFMDDQVRVIVATIAFGMGVDKPDIRFIVHFMPPQSVAAYYQEAGRAGRDGRPARCLLMYSTSDRGLLTRRAHRNAMTVGFLRGVYAAVKHRLDGRSSGRVAMPDLERDLQSDGTQLRVAISTLEEAGLLRRGPDIPRAVTIFLRSGPLPDDAPGLADFCQAARLRPGQPLPLDLAATARKADQPLATMERKLLEWTDAGLIDYRPAMRDMLLEVPSPPQDASERIAALLERYEIIQTQRIDEVFAYARTRHCRHGHINAYLGGRPIDRCQACDRCIDIPPSPDPDLPGEREQLCTILHCASTGKWSWGRFTLARILSGDGSSHANLGPLHQQARAHPDFGALSFRSRTAIQAMLDRLENAGLLCARQLENGGTVLDITSGGRAALEKPAQLDGVILT